MTLDVIIPAYNAHDTIDKALASIAMQKIDEGDEIQIVIVDDCSTDGGYHDCARYWAAQGLNVGVAERKTNGGCGQARQTGMDVTDGEGIFFLDADDVVGSPFALRIMMDGLKLGYDVVMGQFIEETPKHTFITHEANWIWMHGKAYSRKFLKEHDIRFNATRYNEDVGFNSLVNKLTENVLYVPQITYVWENREDSTVRTDHNAYAYDHGWLQFLENMAWATAELEKRNIPNEVIGEHLSAVIARLYWNSMDAHEAVPAVEKKNWSALQKFYETAAKKYADSGVVTPETLRAAYFKVAEQTPMASVPYMTYDGFLKKLGFKG